MLRSPGRWLLPAVPNWQPGYAVRWLVQSALVIAYLLRALWRAPPANIRLGESRLLPTFGAGNSATLLRGC